LSRPARDFRRACAYRQRAVPPREFVPDDHATLAPFADAYGGAPANGGLMFKVVPDETMRGLELRKRSVDSWSTICRRISCTACADPTHRRDNGAGHRLRVHRIQSERSVAEDPRVRWPWRMRSIPPPSSSIFVAVSRGLTTGIVPSMSWAFEKRRQTLQPRSGRSATAPR
jgi:hypothetical protein